MRTVKVIFKNGDIISTRINGTEEEIQAYYVGKVFNIGVAEDNLQTAEDVRFLD